MYGTFYCILILLLIFYSELKTKHAPIYDPALAQTLAEYTSAVGSSDLVAVMARFRLLYWWILLISSKIWCGSGGLEPGAFVQVYTADLTQLFTWTCERCGDLTEVYHHLKTVYDFTKAFQIHILFGVEDSLNLFCGSGVWGGRADCWCEKLLTGNNNMSFTCWTSAYLAWIFFSYYLVIGFILY